VRPDGHEVAGVVEGQGVCGTAGRGYFIEISFIRKDYFPSIGGNGGIAEPEGCFLGLENAKREEVEEKLKRLFHGDVWLGFFTASAASAAVRI